MDRAGDALLLGGGAYRLGHTDLDTGQFQKTTLGSLRLWRCDIIPPLVLDETQGLDEDFLPT